MGFSPMKFPNLPNTITLFRILLIPLFALTYLSHLPFSNWYAACLFLLLALSDLLDGYVARKRKQVTDFGKILDPIADKILIITALILLIGSGVEWWMAIIIIVREVLLTAIRLVILKDKVVVAASWLGKFKTTSQIVAIIALLIHFPFGYWIMVIAVIATIISGIDYLIAIRRKTGNEVVNIPNFITFARLMLIIPFVVLIREGSGLLALICFAIIVVMDKIDGIFARLTKQNTKIGEMFDSFTDWLVPLAAFVTLILNGYFPFQYLGLFLFTAALLILSKILYSRNRNLTSSTPMGKINVGVAYILVGWLLIPLPYLYEVSLTFFITCYATISFFLFNAKSS